MIKFVITRSSNISSLTEKQVEAQQLYRLGIELGLLVCDSSDHCVVSLSKTLYPLLRTDSTQEDRK